jgi:excisionase family DNA binding protein
VQAPPLLGSVRRSKELVSLLIREIQSWQDPTCHTRLTHPKDPPSTAAPCPPDEPFHTIAQVAERLNLSDRQVRYAIDKGLIEAYRFEGKGPGTIRVPASSLIAYIERCKVKPQQRDAWQTTRAKPKGKPFRHLKLSPSEGGRSSLGS